MRVGILGAGQLGLMLAEALYRLNVDVAIYTPATNAPAVRRSAGVTIARWDDEDAMRAFFESCDVVTYESENLPCAPFEALGELVHKLKPGLHVLETVQDRVREKAFLAANDLPRAWSASLDSITELPDIADDIGFPFVLKTSRGGYDGKGQFLIREQGQLQALAPLRAQSTGRWVVEELVDIALEVSCIVGRRVLPNGEDVVEVFPVFENDHRDHILDITVLPARITRRQAAAVQELAVQATRALDVQGLLTVEFFLVRQAGRGYGPEVDGLHLRINEFAPRTHNSGHVSRRACSISQFDALARLLIDLPMGCPHALPGGYAMGQLLGAVWQAQGQDYALDLSVWEAYPDVIETYQYGKQEVRAQRKMGHFITRGNDASSAEAEARAFRKALMGEG